MVMLVSDNKTCLLFFMSTSIKDRWTTSRDGPPVRPRQVATDTGETRCIEGTSVLVTITFFFQTYMRTSSSFEVPCYN